MGLAIFRITHLFVYDTVTTPIRRMFINEEQAVDEAGNFIWEYTPKGIGIRKFIGEILNCHWCTSVWVAAFMLIGYLLLPQIFVLIMWLFSLAAIAVIIEEIVLKHLY